MFATDKNPKNIYIMRKFTTTIALAAMALFGAANTISAQEQESSVGKFKVIEGISYNTNSPNGTWLGYTSDKKAIIYNLTTEKKYEYTATEDTNYYLQTINDNGLAIGQYNNKPAYWTEKKGWVNLPLGKFGEESTGNAEQAYNDGSFIVGNIDYKINGVLYWLPVIWYFNEETQEYEDVVELPYQEKDILGLQAQGMYIRGGISDDGNKIFGRFIDRSGLNYYPVIWNYEGDKKWNYEVRFVDQLINEEEELPVRPVFEGTTPDPYDYMSDEEKAAFDAALKAYEDSMEVYRESYDQELLPKYNPNRYKESYFGDDQDGQDRHNEYLAAMEEYKKNVEEYNKLLQEYKTKYDLFFKDTTFYMVGLNLSDNGKYAATICKYSTDKKNQMGTTVLLDLENDEIHFIPALFGDREYSAPSAVLDDGTVFHFGPKVAGRSINERTYVWNRNMTESINVEEWVKEKSGLAYEEISERMTLEGEPHFAIVSCKDGHILKGHTLMSSYGMLTWTADLAAYDDYVSVKETNNEPVITVWPNPATDIINVKAEEVEYMQLFDLEGKAIRYISGENTMNVSDIASGLYILKVKSGNTIGIKKVRIQR